MADMVRHSVFFRAETTDEADGIIAALKAKAPELNGKAFSFETIIPSPAELLSVTEGSELDKGYSFLKRHPDGIADHGEVPPSEAALELGRKALANEQRFGYRNRYEWNIAEWGCESDAVGPEIERTDNTHFVLRFATPWHIPLPVAAAMKKRFGDAFFLWLYSRTTDDIVPEALPDLLDEGFDVEDLSYPKWETLDEDLLIVPDPEDDEESDDEDDDDTDEDADDDSYDDVISDCVQESLIEYFRTQSVDETVADIAVRVAKAGFGVPLEAVEDFVWGEFWHHVKRHEGPFFCEANKAILRKDGRPTTVEEELDAWFANAADDVHQVFLEHGRDVYDTLCAIESWDKDEAYWLHYPLEAVEASWKRLGIA